MNSVAALHNEIVEIIVNPQATGCHRPVTPVRQWVVLQSGNAKYT